MDIMKAFKEYLPKWSEEKMQPIPTEDQPDRWSVAWADFQNSYLREHHDELVEEYKAMKFKTVGMAEKEQRAKEKKEAEVEIVEEKELSEWEKVQKMLNE